MTSTQNLQGKPLIAQQAVSADSLKYTGKDQGQPFLLLIVPGPCTESMSGQVFSYTCTWTCAGEGYAGCAASAG